MIIKTLGILSLLLFGATPMYAQSYKEDVIYLKNQNIIRGTILSKTDTIIKVQAHDGSIYNYSLSEIQKITAEKAYRNYIYRKSGFANYTEMGPLIAGKTTIAGVTTAAFSFQTVSGYKFNQYAMAGFGAGADLYATQTIVPLFGSFRGDISEKGNVIPFYFVDGGYGVNITQQSSTSGNFKGGILYAAGLGLKIPFNRTSGFLLSAGYRYQKTSYINNNLLTNVIYKRLAIRAGFFL